MHYREFGKDKRKVSVLGFGTMRLPTDNGKMDGVVDENEAARIVRYGIDRGINYIDTAKVYQNSQAEVILGRILQDGYREKVTLATKFPIWDLDSCKDADRIFEQQLRDLKTDRIDVYMLHNIQRRFWPDCLEYRLAEWILQKKERGEIGYVGFSFHDDYEFFAKVVDAFPFWDFCQVQYNYTGENVQMGAQGVRYAAEKGLSLIAMEPLLGGTLAAPAGKMGKMFGSEKGRKFNPVDLALRWLWNQPEFSVVLSGMSTFEQVEQNLQIAERSEVGTLSADEVAFIHELQELYDKSMPVKCTKCRYCMPCPNNVDIPLNFEFYNNFVAKRDMHKDQTLETTLYSVMQESTRAGNCVRCGQCEDHCPQKLPIQDLLEKVHETLKS